MPLASRPASTPDTTITTSVATLRGIVFGGRPLAEAVKAAARFTALFPRPKPMAVR